MRAVLISLAILAGTAQLAHGDPDPKRKLVVLEYRAGSSALPGIAARVVATLTKQTSMRVLGPDQTRAVYGDRMDQVLVRCGGEAGCVAKIGEKIGAAEVLLIGVSELGDVILTMQRIDVPQRQVESRVADSLAAGAVPSETQLASYLTRLLPPTDFLRFGVIDIVANLAGAAVTVGGAPRGVTPIEALTLQAPATYEIRVEKTGYVPFTTKVALPPDGEIKVEAQLSQRSVAAWYQHWYVVAALGVVVTGAAGTTIYFATRDGAAGDAQIHVIGSTH